jgi:hypothetical protein
MVYAHLRVRIALVDLSKARDGLDDEMTELLIDI